MSYEIAFSINGVPIRLTLERWFHITESHDDLASYFFDVLETVENPEIIILGNKGSLKAIRNIGKNKWKHQYWGCRGFRRSKS